MILLFRSEDHVDRWCEQWRQPRGETISPQQCWALAVAWWSGARQPEWRRKTIDEIETLFRGLELTSGFWSLR